MLRFLDSSAVPWSGTPLAILNWSPTTNGLGPDQLFVGTNAQGLTEAQLQRLTFVNPIGWPRGTYTARILASGELVPAVPPSLVFTENSNELTLSWTGDSRLVTSTNLTGPYLFVPGATSPFTTTFTDPTRWFRLVFLSP